MLCTVGCRAFLTDYCSVGGESKRRIAPCAHSWPVVSDGRGGVSVCRCRPRRRRSNRHQRHSAAMAAELTDDGRSSGDARRVLCTHDARDSQMRGPRPQMGSLGSIQRIAAEFWGRGVASNVRSSVSMIFVKKLYDYSDFCDICAGSQEFPKFKLAVAE